MKWYWWLGLGAVVVGGAYMLFFRDNTKRVTDQRADVTGAAAGIAGTVASAMRGVF